MKTKEQYEKWLKKNIEGWTGSLNEDFIKVVFKSGKAESIELHYFSSPSKSKFTKDELAAALLDKKY